MKSLDEIKDDISKKYLGKAGIHGVGIRRKANALCIYTDSETDVEQKAVLQKIEKEAAPFRVVNIQEESAKIG